MEEVVHILPAKTMLADILYIVFKNIGFGLENLGMKVIVVVTDNNAIIKNACQFLINHHQILCLHISTSS